MGDVISASWITTSLASMYYSVENVIKSKGDEKGKVEHTEVERNK